MSKKKITIAITGLNNTDNPGPGVPFIRAIRESDRFDATVIGLAYENLEPGIYMNGITDKTYLIPYPSSGSEQLLARIEQIHRKNPIDVLIPNFDAELFTFIKNESWLRERGIKTFLPEMESFMERSKDNLSSFGKKYDFKVPKSLPLTGAHQVDQLFEELDFPVFVKGKFYDAYKAWDKHEVNTLFHKISAKWGLPVMVQEFVEGTEVNVIALGDGKGNTIGAVPMRKTYITDKGKAWGGITIDDEKMLSLTYDIIRKTKWRGGMELEMIRTRDNEYYIIEINPRLPAWLYLAVAAGQNLPEAMVRLALDEKLEPFHAFKSGKMFIRYSYDLIGDISLFESITVKGEL
ncbi:ATP-grasp domain-containing protein [Prolixibacter denitrificans]|jgi:carbamoyl-phosphate synthase large subunit|uniref:Carbamoyl phosphate synthase n=1 Tax=Prolixibacter denitrificans TaxID=1541063 RepID=A0A2P8CKZ1_9BACT|nr:ATP-grasp domain-containing protein [Prolixibacter denitrificans]PSK85632.1 carbamoyl-phosphate synthase large subunit [Prolixibacter denitrificans]GET20252.1 carbamoyl phosphate synthase [Prolixibacter denitrificans]